MTRRRPIVRRTRRQVLEHWIKALRSGKYKQIRNVLCNGKDGFCCLGVLQELATKDGGDFRTAYKSEVLDHDYWSALAFGVPQNELVEMNDAGTSFRGIANFLEKTVLPKVTS